MAEKSKLFIEEPGDPSFLALGKKEYVVNLHDPYQKNNELLNRLAEQREYRARLIESSTGRISGDK